MHVVASIELLKGAWPIYCTDMQWSSSSLVEEKQKCVGQCVLHLIFTLRNRKGERVEDMCMHSVYVCTKDPWRDTGKLEPSVPPFQEHGQTSDPLLLQ